MKLSQVVTQYVQLKKSMGARFHSEAVILKAFCKALGDVDITDVRPDPVHTYISGIGPVTLFWHRKHQALRGFYRFAIGRGYVGSSPLPTVLPKPTRLFVPYIFSKEELQRILNAAACSENPRRKLEAYTLRTLVFVLYGAGLRVSEALSLTLADVDLNGGLLTVRESKFYKTRIVPLAPRLVSILANYAANRQQRGHSVSESAPFFVTRGGAKVTRQMMERAFSDLRNRAEVHRNDGGRYQPRLHDLRHSFAVHRLVSWYRQRADVQCLLPKLATYLGHINVGATQRYLTMTPELLEEACLRFERYALQEGRS